MESKPNSSDDAVEFVRQANGGRALVAKLIPPSTSPEECSADSDTDPDTGLPGDGAICQYATGALGYTPSARTVKQLPPGIYGLTTGSERWWFEPRTVVTDNLLRLPDSRSDEVITEIERFWTLKDVFRQHGYNHKRGFLLYGPPGGGKTATISIICKKMVESGGVVLLTEDNRPAYITYNLAHLRKIEPDRNIIIVFEDIDAYITKHGEAQVLSLLDGEASICNAVFIATTNYPENLDGRVINRPSRFDRIVKIGMPNAAARKMYLDSRNLRLTGKEVNAWVELTEGFSIAHLKELIVSVVCFGNELSEEVTRMKAMSKLPKSDDPKGKTGFGV